MKELHLDSELEILREEMQIKRTAIERMRDCKGIIRKDIVTIKATQRELERV